MSLSKYSNEVFELFKMFKSNMKVIAEPLELTQKLTTVTTASHSLYPHVVSIVDDYRVLFCESS